MKPATVILIVEQVRFVNRMVIVTLISAILQVIARQKISCVKLLGIILSTGPNLGNHAYLVHVRNVERIRSAPMINVYRNHPHAKAALLMKSAPMTNACRSHRHAIAVRLKKNAKMNNVSQGVIRVPLSELLSAE